MGKNRNQLFPKPTGIAVLAAVLGIALHGAVFFLFKVGVQTPEEIVQTNGGLSYYGQPDPTTVALIDPLTLLVSSERVRPGPGLNDFRALSISREISTFPPYYTIESNREWSSWVPRQINEENPGAWLLEQSESSLRNFGRDPLPDLELPPDRMTVRVVDLIQGDTSHLSIPMSEPIRKSSQGATFLNPATFLLDRTDLWTNPAALLVESSGTVALDRALREALSSFDNAIPHSKSGEYSLVTYFLPPPNPEPAP